MLRRFAHTLIAVMIALSAVFPVNLRAMPMAADMSTMSLRQHCQSCPAPEHTGSKPDKMQLCQILVCAGAVVDLPSPTLRSDRILLRVAYMPAPPIRWGAAARAPDPFPPRPITLV